MTRDNNKTLG